MPARKPETESTTDRELHFTRTLDAPRELVWAAWTDLKHIHRWFGPHGFTTTTESMDFKPGGRWKYVMHGPDGKDWDNLIIYREIVKPARLVYDHGSKEGDPETFHVTVDFEKDGKGTRLVTRMLFATREQKEMRAKHGVPGHKETMDRLAAHLATM